MKKNYTIAVIAGDGIGPEITAVAQDVLTRVGQRLGFAVAYKPVLMGGCAIDATGVPLPQATVDTCLAADAVLLGAVGGPKWDTLPGHLRPEAGLLGIRAALGLFANIRPAVLFSSLAAACPLRADIAARGIDLVVFRELTGGIYFGKRGSGTDGKGRVAYDTETYSEEEIARIVRLAFESARTRRKKVTSIDKANVLDSSRLWRAVTQEIAAEYPDIQYENMLVDNAAMQLVKNPAQFDVVVTSNMFGDILSDEASMITGSIGMLPSSSLGYTKLGLYEPIHGSAPDIAGKDLANPIATVLSIAMMLESSLDCPDGAALVRDAVAAVLEKGYRTADIWSEGTRKVGCVEMGKLLAAELKIDN
ncbi:MAG: 3-isopropylmalate dehydrogenase [Clostridiales bacterium]|jgi:3-isopropylmalate dehydrogenase|nr:3-isopropylmalate dehydrogenase [Clostridiales bacterium]